MKIKTRIENKQFGLKTLFVFTTIFAVCAVFATFEWRMSRFNITAANIIIDAGGHAVLECDAPDWMCQFIPFQSFQMRVTEAEFQKGYSVPDFQMLGRLTNLRALSLNGYTFSKNQFQEIGSLNQLKYLDLSKSNLSDETLSYLSTLSNLVYLHISDTRITDDSINQFNKYPSLKRVFASECRLSTAGKFQINKIMALRRGETLK